MENQIKPLLPYNPNIDEKTAMKEAMKIWAWLKETGLRKNDHPEWKIILTYNESCPLCSVFTSFYCNKCPLCELCCYEWGSLYHQWMKTGRAGDTASKCAATAIYDKIAQSYKQRYGVKYNPYEK